VSAILSAWKRGLGLPDTLVIDGHVHVGEWPHAATFADVDEAERESAAYLDANGVDAFCAVGGGGMFNATDYRVGNDFLLALWRRLPDRLIPFLSLNPNDTPADLREELERMHGEGVRCVKLINDYQERYPGDGPNLRLVYEFAARRGMLVFNHAWDPHVIREVSQRHPDTDFVFAHYHEGLDEVLVERPNVYTNIWSLGSLGWLDRGLRRVGARKFMLGSDGFLNPLSVGIGPVVFSAASDAEKRLVLGLNAARLLAKAGALPAALERRYAAARVAAGEVDP
jgi:uncharacterized protein